MPRGRAEGGCAALRLGFELIATANPNARVLVGAPTWPNHPPIIRAVGLQLVEYSFYDRASCSIRFDSLVSALKEARAGDIPVFVLGRGSNLIVPDGGVDGLVISLPECLAQIPDVQLAAGPICQRVVRDQNATGTCHRSAAAA